MNIYNCLMSNKSEIKENVEKTVRLRWNQINTKGMRGKRNFSEVSIDNHFGFRSKGAWEPSLELYMLIKRTAPMGPSFP